jgi:pimeloyl-ACP methyl ester carboxylesterase
MAATGWINGIELGWQELGEGDPLVLLHGGYATGEMFGENLGRLAERHRVIAVDLQSHGRTPAADRPMRFETMGDDIAALLAHLGLERAAVMGFSLGGAVALRTAIQHPALVERLVLVSAPYARSGWYPEMRAGMDAMGPETTAFLRQTPLYTAYAAVAPDPEAGWPALVGQLAELLKIDYDWSDEVRALAMPVELVAGDADGLSPAHVAEFFALLGGGLRDANWDLSGRTHHRMAILPGATHYDINLRPGLAAAVLPFLAGE